MSISLNFLVYFAQPPPITFSASQAFANQAAEEIGTGTRILATGWTVTKS
jgi:hypothetical protein